MHPVVPGMNINNGNGTEWWIFYWGLVIIIKGRVLMIVRDVFHIPTNIPSLYFRK